MLITLTLLAHIGVLPPALPVPAIHDSLPAAQPPTVTYPFKVGETLHYTASIGYLPIGSADLAVTGLARERGAETFVLTLSGEGGPPGFGISYEATSWVGTKQFTSRRFHRRVAQAGQVTDQSFLIYPDSARYREVGNPEAWVAPRDALDEVAFLYFLRTTPLEVGRTYSWARYFRTGFNPVQVQVTGREAVRLPTGETPTCLVLHVTTRAGASDLWLTDDARRLPAQARVPLNFGTVTLQLAGVGAGAGSESARR
ncbi:MAG TPA: DUF3108 domain-containing protein [Gemmatimonadales bacterium]|nr:DUF3108 domain-containing protein [Gemmatimonadales bacterium]